MSTETMTSAASALLRAGAPGKLAREVLPSEPAADVSDLAQASGPGPGPGPGPGSVNTATAWSYPLPKTYVEADEVLGVLLDAVVAADRELAVVAARRAELVDQVRRWSKDSVDALARARGRERGSLSDHTIAARSTTAELACALRMPEGSVTALLAESQALVHELPATMESLSDGSLSYRHAQVVMSATAALDDAPRLTLDTMLAARAKTTTVPNLSRVARRARERHDQRPLVDRHTAALVERRVELELARDGMAWLHQLMPAVHASAIFHRLSDIAAACQGPDEPRTLAQLRADVCVELLLDDDARSAATGSARVSPTTAGVAADGVVSSAAACRTTAGIAGDGVVTSATAGAGTGTGAAATRSPGTTRQLRGESGSTPADSPAVSLRGIRPTVAVTVPVMTLLGHSDEPGDLAGYGPIDAATARDLAAHAPSFIRLLTHPETGAILSVGRERYTVPADLRSWLKIRDETCRFPGCSRRAERCDVDHVDDWAHGGATSHGNLIHLCRKHHRLKHASRWTPRTGGGDPGRGTSARMVSARAAGRDGPGVSGGTAGDHGTGGQDGSRPPGSTAGDHGSGGQDGSRPPGSTAGDRGSGGRDGTVVLWDAPSGRTYVDHSAVALQPSRTETHDATSRRSRSDDSSRDSAAAPWSTFDGPPPF